MAKQALLLSTWLGGFSSCPGTPPSLHMAIRAACHLFYLEGAVLWTMVPTTPIKGDLSQEGNQLEQEAHSLNVLLNVSSQNHKRKNCSFHMVKQHKDL